jgi:hypothetical protein
MGTRARLTPDLGLRRWGDGRRDPVENGALLAQDPGQVAESLEVFSPMEVTTAMSGSTSARSVATSPG